MEGVNRSIKLMLMIFFKKKKKKIVEQLRKSYFDF